MLRFRPEARVGLVIFIGLFALVLIYWFLGGLRLSARTYTIYAIFRNIQRLSEGAEVRMAGVPIGKVSRISLWRQSRARVEMIIRQDVKIPRGSRFGVTSGSLVGDVYVEVTPATPATAYLKPGESVYGSDAVTLDQLLPQVNELLTQLEGSAQGLNRILGSEETQASIGRTLANTEQATAQAVALVADMRRMAARSGAAADRALSNAANASTDFARVASQLRDAIETGGAQDIKDTLDRVSRSAANLERATADVQEITSDPELAADIRATVANAREASEDAKELAARLNRLAGGRRREPRKGPAIPNMGASLDVFANLEESDYRVDFNLNFPTGNGRFYRAGLYNIGESTKLNLQYGRMLDLNSSFRYGLYASKIGVGYDRFFGRRASLHADLFRPNDLQLEVKGLYNLSDDIGLWLGSDDLLDNGSFLIGAQFRK